MVPNPKFTNKPDERPLYSPLIERRPARLSEDQPQDCSRGTGLTTLGLLPPAPTPGPANTNQLRACFHRTCSVNLRPRDAAATALDCSGSQAKNAEAPQEFDQLRAAAYRVTRLPYPESNPEAHMAASLVLVERSDLLLAVWDGQPARELRRHGGRAGVRTASEGSRPHRLASRVRPRLAGCVNCHRPLVTITPGLQAAQPPLERE